MFTRAPQSTGGMVPCCYGEESTRRMLPIFMRACGRSLWIRSALRQRGYRFRAPHGSKKQRWQRPPVVLSHPHVEDRGHPRVCQRRRFSPNATATWKCRRWQKRTAGERGDVISGPMCFENRTASNRFGGARSARRTTVDLDGPRPPDLEKTNTVDPLELGAH